VREEEPMEMQTDANTLRDVLTIAGPS